MRVIFLHIIAVAMFLAATPARAVIAYVDNFSIVKNGNLFFQDSFTDGAEPPNAPNFPNGTTATYFVNGTLQSDSESAGKLRLNSTDGATVVNAVGISNSSLGIILLSNTDPTNLDNGLKIDDTFGLTGIFDLVENTGPLFSGYGVAFNDAGNGLDRRNEVNLQVLFSETLGMNIIRLSYQDFDSDTVTNVFLPLGAPAGADQISLSLMRGDVNTSDLVASYAYLDNGAIVGSGTVGTASVFQDRNWVRGLFFAASSQAVPEPGTLALLSLGLAGLAATRRRNQSH